MMEILDGPGQGLTLRVAGNRCSLSPLVISLAAMCGLFVPDFYADVGIWTILGMILIGKFTDFAMKQLRWASS